MSVEWFCQCGPESSWNQWNFSFCHLHISRFFFLGHLSDLRYLLLDWGTYFVFWLSSNLRWDKKRLPSPREQCNIIAKIRAGYDPQSRSTNAMKIDSRRSGRICDIANRNYDNYAEASIYCNDVFLYIVFYIETKKRSTEACNLVGGQRPVFKNATNLIAESK